MTFKKVNPLNWLSFWRLDKLTQSFNLFLLDIFRTYQAPETKLEDLEIEKSKQKLYFDIKVHFEKLLPKFVERLFKLNG